MFFIIGLFIGWVLAYLLVNIFLNKVLAVKTKPSCPPHDWESRVVDPGDLSWGSYLICKKCKKLPNGLPVIDNKNE